MSKLAFRSFHCFYIHFLFSLFYFWFIVHLFILNPLLFIYFKRFNDCNYCFIPFRITYLYLFIPVVCTLGCKLMYERCFMNKVIIILIKRQQTIRPPKCQSKGALLELFMSEGFLSCASPNLCIDGKINFFKAMD